MTPTKLALRFNTDLTMNNVHLSSDDISRYSRQLMLDDIDEKGQARLKQAYAVIIGLGGLGSLVARYLVGAGIGKVLLVDNDTVDKSNIHRQVLFNQEHIGQHKSTFIYPTSRDKKDLYIGAKLQPIFVD